MAETQLTGKRTGHRDERAIVLELMYRYGGASQARSASWWDWITRP
jgi:hypothetical protein